MTDSSSFLTLSSSFSSSCTSENDVPIGQLSSTHDTSRSAYHISDISSFAKDLQNAANQAFPNRGKSRYHTVNVCLIRWEEDELCVKDELERLHDVFDKLYGFNTEIWLIPSSASQIQLTSMTCSFLQRFDAEGNLFVVYYGGHGKINAARQNQWWCNAKPGSAFVDWSAVQTLFGTARSDVLILLDCCAAASSAVGSGPGVMEAIAACGWETRAPPPGPFSFTNTLIEVLEEWVSKPSFSAAMLHAEVLFVLKQKRPERVRDGRRLEWCSTPIHWVYTVNPKAAGIELSCLKVVEVIRKTAITGNENQTRSTTYVDPMDLDDDSCGTLLNACNSEGDYQIPHILISIALEGDQGALDALSCRRWLADFPALAKYATIEGVYKGFSTLMTMSVPVMIWDLLPNHPACSFIGYTISPNKYHLPSNDQQMVSSTIPDKVPSRRRVTARTRLRGRDPFISSCDSSYGSQPNSVRSESRALSEVSVDSDFDINEQDLHSSDEDEDEDNYDLPAWNTPAVDYDITPAVRDEKFSRRDISTDAGMRKSLITHMLRDDPLPSPIDIPNEITSNRSSTPSQSILSPRSARRNMVADELAASLREHILYERQTRARLACLRTESLLDDLDADGSREDVDP